MAADIVFNPEDYLLRNYAIVEATDLLVAAPRTSKEILRNGTWATIRYAREAKPGMQVKIFEP